METKRRPFRRHLAGRTRWVMLAASLFLAGSQTTGCTPGCGPTGPIPDGEGVISGNFTEDKTKELVGILNSDPLPFPIRVKK